MVGWLGKNLRAYAEKDGRGYPDWAMRYVPIVRRLKPRIESSSRILEIGANENGLSRFLGRRVIALDLHLSHLEASRAAQDVLPVVGSIEHLPFRDDVFDVCASVDTFEHIPSTLRMTAVKEIVRVMSATGSGVVAFPLGPGPQAAEAVIRARYKAHCGGTIRWLEEHVEEGLPDAGPIFVQFQRSAGETHVTTVSKNANVRVWRWIWLVLMCGWPGRGNALFQALLRFVTPVLVRMHFGDCYRVMVWVEPRDEDTP